MPTTVMYSLPDGDPCSGHSTMIGAHDACSVMVDGMEPYSVMVDGDCGDGASLLMM